MHLAHNDHLLLRAFIISVVILLLGINYLPYISVSFNFPSFEKTLLQSRLEIGRRLIEILGYKMKYKSTYPTLDSKLFLQEIQSPYIYPPGRIHNINTNNNLYFVPTPLGI